ncbi:MAG TPA: chromate transporter [Candidatus Coprenecus stercoravium]|uniref:Chromate transporter n=1 Tax=Candidatus Coprenecus stercoravium TaxID=2840735 RepID=A0A9D2GQM5_9BACT|nr:chromate transporter [Candidatus Coprenecus stercoravium]
MIFIELFLTFFLIGAFTFGGGYAMLSLIQNQVVTVHQWLTPEEFTDIVAISQMSPGPIGINSATYIGYSVPHALGMGPALSFLGSLTATFAVVLPSYLIVLWICILYEKFKTNRYFASVLKVMRPVTIGMIAAAAIILITPYNFIDWWSWALFAVSFAAMLFFKANPIWIIVASGAAGYLIYGI